MAATSIRLDGVRIHDKAARQVAQSLAPADAPAPWRDVNGALRISSRESLSRKFKSSLSGTYMLPPELGGVWVGRVLQVQCVAEIVHVGKVEEAASERPAVYGSVIYEGADGRPLPDNAPAGIVARTRYRPVLTMMVTGFQVSSSETAAEVGWTIDLEEV